MSTQAGLILNDTPEGLSVEGYSKDPGDLNSTANVVLHYLVRHWNEIAQAAVLFERTSAVANIPHTKVPASASWSDAGPSPSDTNAE
jgi:hypothetical protein